MYYILYIFYICKIKIILPCELCVCVCVCVLCVFVFPAAVLYYYFYKRTTEYLGDPRLYEDSPWLRDAFARARQ